MIIDRLRMNFVRNFVMILDRLRMNFVMRFDRLRMNLNQLGANLNRLRMNFVVILDRLRANLCNRMDVILLFFRIT